MSDMTETIMRLQHENNILKNRCFALSKGEMCLFCPLICVNRTKAFRGKKDKE